MGSSPTPQQKEFVDAVLNSLKTVGLSPRIMGENEWTHGRPLKGIKDIIMECEGLVIIAFTRTKFDKGTESKGEINKELTNILLPTPWNHIEGSIAYSFDLPLLVIAENGLKSEGLIEKGHDWTVYWTDLSVNNVNSNSFSGFLLSWKKAVEKRELEKATKPIGEFDAEKIPASKILKSLTISQWWKIGTAIGALLITIATIFYKLGGGKFPWEN